MPAKKFHTNAFMLESRTKPMDFVELDFKKDFPELRSSNSDVQVPANTQKTSPSYSDIISRPGHNVNSRMNHTASNRVKNFAQNRNGFDTHNAQTGSNHVNYRNQQHNDYSRERNQQNDFDHTNSRNNYMNLQSSENRFDYQTRYQNSRRYYNNSTNNNTNNAIYQNRRPFNRNNDVFRNRNNVPENDTIQSAPKKRIVVHYSLAKNSIVELNTCANAWVPSCRVVQKPIESNEIEIEEILKKVRSILNKITPETMIVLTKSILDMPITTYKSLVKIIDLLFQKAIDEPNFTPQYAYICSQMEHIEVVSEDRVTKTSFKQLIVRKCQQTFELVNATEENAIDSLLEIESCKDQTLKKELQCKYDENERNQRKRSVGNCRFMCEMFKVKLLNSNVLEKCVRHLLKFPKEEPLECLCNILKHIGKYLNPENTFEKLREFSSSSYKNKISSRIRFMILDTIELKNNNWVPRNSVIKPKTLNEINEEFNMLSTKNLKMSSPIEKSSNRHLNSNTKKVSTKASNVQTKSESYSNILQNNITKKINSNFEKKEIEHDLLAKTNAVELNTSKNAWVPRSRNSQKPTVTNKDNIKEVEKRVQIYPKPNTLTNTTTSYEQGKIDEIKIISSNSEKKKSEPDSRTKSSKIELKTCKNPWVPRFRNSQKLTEAKGVEMKETEKKAQKSPKPDTSIEFMKNSIQKTTAKRQTVINAERVVKSDPEKKKIQPDSLTKSSENELNTCKNPSVPRFRNTVKSTMATEVKTEKIENKVQKLPEPDTSMKIMTEIQQDSCETFSTIIFSMTQENMIASINKLTPRISSNDLIEETIDVLFERAMTEPNSISLVVETCNYLKKIVISTDNGSKHVSFKKQLAVRCQKLLRMEKLERDLKNKTPVISKETYTMIGELYNKKILPLNILVEFIKDIPNRFTGESIENICYLLTIIGVEIERPYSLKPTIQFLETFVNNDIKTISPKLKKVVTNLIELHTNKWNPLKKIDPPPSIVETDENCSQPEDENPKPTPEEISKDDETRTRRTKYFSEMIAESYSNIKIKCADFSKRIAEFDFRGCFWNFVNYCQSFIW